MTIHWAPLWHYLRPVVLSPFQLLALALIFEELGIASQAKRLVVFGLIILTTVYSIILSSTAHPAWQYGWGLLNTWAATVWAPLWLWCVDARSSRRLHYQQYSKASGVWKIQERPTARTLACIGWTLHLLSDFRAIHWSHGIRKDSPWRNLQSACSENETNELKEESATPLDLSNDHRCTMQDLFRRALSLCLATALLKFCSFQYQRYLRLGSSQHMVVRTDAMISYSIILATTRATVAATCTYCLIVSIHSAITIPQMGWFFVRTRRAPPLWMFPPLFGHKFTADITAFWSRTWQDTFHFSLTTLSRRVRLGGVPKIVNGLLQACFAFTFSGVFHAAASYAVDKDVRSALATLFIFMMQPLAAMVQILISKSMRAVTGSSYLVDTVTAMIGFAWLVTTVNLVAATPTFDAVLCSFA